MSQHYTGNTVSVSKWCPKCEAHTQHRVDGHRVSNVCIPCQEKAESDHQARLAGEIHTHVAALAAERERELRRTYGIPMEPTEVEVCCPCSALAFPHIHPGEVRRLSIIRFNNRQPERRA